MVCQRGLPVQQAGQLPGERILLNGVLPFNNNHEFVGMGNIRVQVEQSMDNLGMALAAAGFDYGDVVESTTRCHPRFGFDRYNEIYQKCFREPFPVRATIQGMPEHMAALVRIRGDRGERRAPNCRG